MGIETKELRRLLAAATPGPWSDSDGYGDQINAPSPKGGTFIVAQVRGWGHFTGRGTGGMGMSDTDAMDQQDANAKMIVAAINILPALLDAIDASATTIQDRDAEIERLRETQLTGLELAKMAMMAIEFPKLQADNARLAAENAALREMAASALDSCADIQGRSNVKFSFEEQYERALKEISGREPITKRESQTGWETVPPICGPGVTYRGPHSTPDAADRLMAAQQGDQRGRPPQDKDYPFETVDAGEGHE